MNPWLHGKHGINVSLFSLFSIFYQLPFLLSYCPADTVEYPETWFPEKVFLSDWSQLNKLGITKPEIVFL